MYRSGNHLSDDSIQITPGFNVHGSPTTTTIKFQAPSFSEIQGMHRVEFPRIITGGCFSQ